MCFQLDQSFCVYASHKTLQVFRIIHCAQIHIEVLGFIQISAEETDSVSMLKKVEYSSWVQRTHSVFQILP